MNTLLMKALIETHGYSIDRINVTYDIMPCEYKVEIALASKYLDEVLFKKEFDDTTEGIEKFGACIEELGKMIRDTAKEEKE